VVKRNDKKHNKNKRGNYFRKRQSNFKPIKLISFIKCKTGVQNPCYICPPAGRVGKVFKV